MGTRKKWRQGEGQGRPPILSSKKSLTLTAHCIPHGILERLTRQGPRLRGVTEQRERWKKAQPAVICRGQCSAWTQKAKSGEQELAETKVVLDPENFLEETDKHVEEGA